MSTKKKESDIGKLYERDVLALIGMKCLLRNDILDFWMCTNTSGIEKFDDLILHVEYKDNRKEIFFVQLKHKEKGDKPIVVQMFKRKQGDFCLEMFRGAYESIMDNTEFFSSNEISRDTEMFFVLHNNCKVEMRSKEDMCFELVSKEDFRSFISSNSSQDVSTEYTIKDVDTCAKFLSRFYFYAGQLSSKEVPSEIEKLVGLNKDIVTNIIKHFYDFSDSKSTVEKLYKLDLKTKLLGYIFGDYVPPSEISKNFSLLPVIEKYDVTVINEEDSAVAIWSDILMKMRKCYNQESLELTNWERALPINMQDEFRTRLNLEKDVEINTKHLYFHMVAKRLVPFYIESKNRHFSIFFEDLITKLEVISVIFDSKKFFMHTGNTEDRRDLKFLGNLNDLDDEQYLALTSRVKVSLQGKEGVPLSSFAYDKSFRQKINMDLLISLLDTNLEFGSVRKEESVYIARKLKVPVLKESIVANGEYLFVVCGISSLKSFDSMPLNSYLSIKIRDDQGMEELDYDKAFPILTTSEDFDHRLTKKIEEIPNVELYCILQFVYTKNSNNRFILKATNRPLEFMKAAVCQDDYYIIDDTELLERNIDSRINIICNKAGMGKTMLLHHISQKFSPGEWVVHLELGKFFTELKGIRDFGEFLQFIRNIEKKTVEERYRGIFELLHQHHIEHGNMVLLLDDYEEINDRKLLEILKICINHGIGIWMVGRPILKRELEETFRVFSMELEEFSIEDQNTFFRKFFGRNNNDEEFRKKISLVEKTRDRLENSFIGICQQTMMLAVVLDSDENITDDYIRIDDLYEKFINLHIAQHYLKYRRFILRILCKLALYSFFSEKVLQKLFDMDDFGCEIEVFRGENPKAAIITEFKENNFPLFSHKTYAEFLAARWLAHTTIKQIKKKTSFDITQILKLLYCQELTNVRLFYDNLLTKNNPAHSAIINNDFSIDAILGRGHKADILGRTIYHMTMSYGKRYQIHTIPEMDQELQNYEERAQIYKEGQLIVLKIPELATETKLNDFKHTILLNSSFLEMMKRDKVLIKNAVDFALMSGSLEELDIALNTDVFVSNLQSETIFRVMNPDNLCLVMVHSIKNNFNRIFSKLLSLQNIRNILIKIREWQTGMSLLHLAVEYKNFSAVKQLVLIDPTIENWGTDKEKNTPLHLACQNKKFLFYFDSLGKFSQSFLNARNNKGWSHLHSFAYHNNTEGVEKCLKCPGIEVDSACIQGNTPFILSVMKKNLQIAELLKDNGADINIGNRHKMTALHFSTSRGLYECTRKLTQWGAKLDVQTTYGATPLIKASSWGHVKIVELLLEKGANISSADLNKWTPLHHAVKRKKLKVIETLVRHGADVNALTDNRHTPLIIACNHNVPQAISILLKNHLLDINDLYTALEIARGKKHDRCVSLIETALFGPCRPQAQSGPMQPIHQLQPQSSIQPIQSFLPGAMDYLLRRKKPLEDTLREMGFVKQLSNATDSSSKDNSAKVTPTSQDKYYDSSGDDDDQEDDEFDDTEDEDYDELDDTEGEDDDEDEDEEDEDSEKSSEESGDWETEEYETENYEEDDEGNEENDEGDEYNEIDLNQPLIQLGRFPNSFLLRR